MGRSMSEEGRKLGARVRAESMLGISTLTSSRHRREVIGEGTGK